MEAATHRTFLYMEATYAIKNQLQAQNTPNLVGVAKPWKYFKTVKPLTDESGPGCYVLIIEPERFKVQSF